MFAAGKTAAVSGAGPDAKFNYVTMLLHGDGTNGAQNNTFVDSSTNNFTITRNGNTTQGSFSPYGSNWSNFFGGSDGLSLASSSSLSPEAGDFCVEAWIFPQTTGGSYYTVYSGPAGGMYFGFLGGGGFGLRQRGGSDLISATSPSVNTWTHVAATRSGTSLRLFYNGVQQGSTVSDSTNFAVGAAGVGDIPDTSLGWLGYISNCRFVKGSAVYTSDFTPSTSPLTAISGTQLLTCQSNRFIDNSSSPKTISVSVGAPSVQRFNPFGTSTAYSTATIGGSGYFDGTGDYLQVANNSAFDFSGDFTVECWLYLSNTNNQTFISKGGHNALGPDAGGWALFIYSNSIQFNTRDNAGGANNYITVLSSPKTNTWMHIAVTRNGTNMRAFLNGTLASTVTSSVNTANSSPFNIGSNLNNLSPSTGYICDVRIIKGSAEYTTSFTPPTAPLTAISGTSLLCSMQNGAIYDNAMMNDLETVGDTQISTSVKKYGTGSMKFDGNGDGLLIPASQNTTFGTGDLTVEFWLYTADSAALYDFIDFRGSGGTGTAYVIYQASGSIVVARSNTTDLIIATSPSASTWHHIALTRTSSSLKLFIDGVQVGSTVTDTTNYSTAYPWAIGYFPGNPNFYLDGYIDDLRITKGYARYTANFTPPTSALADKSTS